jgi:predicted RND superfamily exporter protein
MIVRLLRSLADRFVLERPVLALLLVLLVTLIFAAFIPRFQLDASADSLLLEDDQDLRYYTGITARYGSDNYLVITYSSERLFEEETLADLQQLRDELRALDTVEGVISILDVPLIDSPRVTISQLQEYVPILENPEVSRELARRELRTSPIYSNLLLSPDGETTSLLVSFRVDPEFRRLNEERDALREKMLTSELSSEEERRKDELSAEILEMRRSLMDSQQEDIRRVRKILDEHRDLGEIHIGGLPMIVSDMIDYIRNDILVFGSGIVAILIVLLSLIFGRPRWVVVAMLCCASSAIIMTGFLGLVRWPVTVVSSNYVALMLIFSLSLTVHLIQRYRELHNEHPDQEQRWLVRETLIDKAAPCFFTAVTTAVGFASLIVSGIRPVIDFGWMMVIGLLVVLLTAFVIFPATLALLSPGTSRHYGDSLEVVTGMFARLTDRRAALTAVVCALLGIAGLIGVSRLEVENRFIDYFKADTDIYQGLVTIDQRLGGTAPLDIILDADPEFQAARSVPGEPDEGFADDFDDEFDDELGDEFDDEFADEFGDEFTDESVVSNGGKAKTDLGATSYWYNTFRLGQLEEVHDYLESLPETGKVLSMATTIETLEILNQDETPGTFFLSVLYNRLPADLKSALYDPYMSKDGNQVRLSARVFESDPNLRRDELIRSIRTHLVDNMGYKRDQVHVTGMLVLYNNLLQSLYRSQILTLGVVFAVIMVMFGVLFRSVKISLVAILPSILSVLVVLGIMGLGGIPLDIMTITIAAISVGIGVDDSIHYIHRYRQEISKDGDGLGAMYRSHASVGRAMFYTSVIVIAGFSVLALSNFIPSILFGLLTGLAMAMALAANLTLLPLLLKWWNVR